MAKIGRKRKFLRVEAPEDNSILSFRMRKTRTKQMHLDSQMREERDLEKLVSKKNDTKINPPSQIVIDVSDSGNESKEDDYKQNPSPCPLVTCKGGVNSPKRCGNSKGDVNGGMSSRSGDENLSYTDLQSRSSCQSNSEVSYTHHKADYMASDDEIENNVAPYDFSRYSLRLRKQREEAQKSTIVPRLRGIPRKLESTGVAESTSKEDLLDNRDIPLNGISLREVPTSTRKLLSTGFLEGYSVQYAHRNELLLGRIVRGGILCQCSSCKGQEIVNLTNFEKHAGSGAKRPSDYIRFENGVNFTQLVNIICNTALPNIPTVIKSTLEIVSSETPDSNCIKPRQLPIKHDLDPITESTVQEISPGKRKVSTLTSIECAVVCDNLKGRRGRPSSMNVNGIPGHAKGGRTATNSVSKSDHVKRGRGRPPKMDLEPSEKYPGEYNNTPNSSKKSKETGLHKLLFMPFGLSDGTKVAYNIEGQRFLYGYKEGSGINCSCCNQVVSCSQFEVHAGWGNRKSPYKHIYLSNGRSLHDEALSIANDNDRRNCENRYLDPSLNDDYCAVCGDGGDLVQCDSCPKYFHIECLGLARDPPGKRWFCSSCRPCSVTQRKTSKTDDCKLSVNVGRHASKGKSSKRQTHVVNKVTNNNKGGCILCRSEDFTKYGFDEWTILFCDQCEKEFHVGCLRTHSIADLKELPKGKWFCCHDCREIHSELQNHVADASKSLPMQAFEELKKKVMIDGEEGLHDEIRWQILHGKTKNPDSKELLSEAVAIFHECFDSILDPCTGRDLIPLMLYSKSMRDTEFGGMYSAVLTVNSKVVSVAVFRVLGRQTAELPLAATRCTSQGQGYFQSLFACIEELLGSLNIERIVLPAAEEAESFWTKKFGFMKMSGAQFHEFTKDLQLTDFAGASMLGKTLSPHYKSIP